MNVNGLEVMGAGGLGDLIGQISGAVEEMRAERMAEVMEGEAWKGLTEEEQGLMQGIAGKITEASQLIGNAREQLGVERFTWLILALVQEGRARDSKECGLRSCVEGCSISQIARVTLSHLTKEDQVIGERVAESLFHKAMEAKAA